MRDRCLQGVGAIIERQERVPAEGDDNRLLLNGKRRGMRLLRTGRQIFDCCTPLPLRHGLMVDPVALGQNPQALLTMLYRSTDRLCRAGAPMKNLAHSASFHSWLNNAPSNAGTRAR